MGDNVIRRFLVAASLLWVAALVGATSVGARSRAGSAASVLSLATYAVGSLVCHQRPERSFHFWGAQFPVCARCAGIYAGAALTAIIASAIRHWTDVNRVLHDAWPALSAAALPTVLTFAYEWTSGDMPSNGIRFAAGLPLGAAVMWLVISVSTSRRAVEVH